MTDMTQTDNPSGHDRNTLSEVLHTLQDTIQGEYITIAEILQTFRHRGFGTLLVLPSLIVILPTGAVPMIPAICGVMIAFICVQMMLGREHPWLPQRIMEFKIPRRRLETGIEKSLPATKLLDRYIYARFRFLTNNLSKRLTAALCFVLSLVMISIGFIPMLPATLALPIFFFGLGYVVRDGLIIGLGYFTIAGSYVGLYFFLEAI